VTRIGELGATLAVTSNRRTLEDREAGKIKEKSELNNNWDMTDIRIGKNINESTVCKKHYIEHYHFKWS
jgi:hypothetical protein